MLARSKKILVLLSLCLLYGLISIFNAYTMIKKHNEGLSNFKFPKEIPVMYRRVDTVGNAFPNTNSRAQHLEIWDSSGVGLYLWKHILQGKLPETENNGWYESSINVESLQIWYRFGYGMMPEQTPLLFSENMFLALNGRSRAMTDKSKSWLNYILSNRIVLNVGLLLLGDESCNNEWLKPYLLNDKLRVIFLIYDSPMIDNKRIFGWPLGVASYRGFSEAEQNTIALTKQRMYSCNFYGTVYEGSSRQELMTLVNDSSFANCKFRWRKRWPQDETDDTLFSYEHVLANSDLTISPVGQNAECYRTYEAIEYGSIPVIENVVTSKKCIISLKLVNESQASPYFILKEHKAPLIYVKSWNELPGIMKLFSDMSVSQKVRLRLNLLRWYIDFKKSMKIKFLHNTIKLFHWNFER